jgi:MtN3 and saliva related transmembrane protein
MSQLTTIVGLLAAVLTTLANVPQVLKAWRTRETQDLSLVMVLTLASGLALWVVYGVMKGDAVLIGANGVALAIALVLAALKLRHG